MQDTYVLLFRSRQCIRQDFVTRYDHPLRALPTDGCHAIFVQFKSVQVTCALLSVHIYRSITLNRDISFDRSRPPERSFWVWSMIIYIDLNGGKGRHFVL
jgi:hypothetical protein